MCDFDRVRSRQNWILAWFVDAAKGQTSLVRGSEWNGGERRIGRLRGDTGVRVRVCVKEIVFVWFLCCSFIWRANFLAFSQW